MDNAETISIEDPIEDDDNQEISDWELDIPTVDTLPTLDSILQDIEDGKPGEQSPARFSLKENKISSSVLEFKLLQSISTQLSSACDRAQAGLASSICYSDRNIVVGTAHGFVLTFDPDQKLCWCHSDQENGGVSALAISSDYERLLVGHERGLICMLDMMDGSVLRKMPEVHAPESAVLRLKFTDWRDLALCGDSTGCIFTLTFNRKLGRRSWDYRCLFSGARGEATTFEPLLLPFDHPFRPNVFVALATLSKVIVINIRPKLKVIHTYGLPLEPKSLPQLAWKLVTNRPLLVSARGTDVTLGTVVGGENGRLRMVTLRSIRMQYSILAIHWLGPRLLAYLDPTETLRLIDLGARNQEPQIEILDLGKVGLVYGSAHFKALATGGRVSAAFALAGERACYNSFASKGATVLILGTRTVHSIRARSFEERLHFLSNREQWTELLTLGSSSTSPQQLVTVKQVLDKFLIYIQTHEIRKETLRAAVRCCVRLKNTSLLTELQDRIISNDEYTGWFFDILKDAICQKEIQFLNPSIVQSLVDHLAVRRDAAGFEEVVLSLDIDCLDLHQVMKLCLATGSYKAWIYLSTQAMNDYVAPLTELLPQLNEQNHDLGNVVLVYVSTSLAGLAFPRGRIAASQVSRVKHEVLRSLTAVHSSRQREGELPYPYLRALLQFNTRECLNVLGLAFREEEFSGELGQMQRLRVIRILLKIVTAPDFGEERHVNVLCFIVRLAKNRLINIDDETVETIIDSLKNLSVTELPLRDHEEREQAWMDLMFMGKLKNLDAAERLEIALRSNCYRLAEIIYETSNQLDQMLKCYVKDAPRCLEAFKYMKKHVGTPERLIRQQVEEYLSELIEIDCEELAAFIMERFPDLVPVVCAKLADNKEQLYRFLKEVVAAEFQISSEIALLYLELVVDQEPSCAELFIKQKLCPPEQALEVLQGRNLPSATAAVLEQLGEFSGALQLLVDADLVSEAVGLCVRASDHLQASEAQELWLSLVRGAAQPHLLGQLLGSAVRYVQLPALLDFMSDAPLANARGLLSGMLADAANEEVILSTALQIQGQDLHSKLADSLKESNRGVYFDSGTCRLCGSSLLLDQGAALFGCGHAFHERCIQYPVTVCPRCHRPVDSHIPDTVSTTN